MTYPGRSQGIVFILRCNVDRMSFEKENFLRTKLVKHLQQLSPTAQPIWGQMSVQHMVEHLLNEGVRIANGQRKFEAIITPPEHLGKMRAFIASDK